MHTYLLNPKSASYRHYRLGIRTLLKAKAIACLQRHQSSLLQSKFQRGFYEIENEIKIKTKYWYEYLHCSRQHKTKINKKKLLNRQLVIENQVMENGIKNEIQVKVKTKYWHKSRHCSRRHSTKIK